MKLIICLYKKIRKYFIIKGTSSLKLIRLGDYDLLLFSIDNNWRLVLLDLFKDNYQSLKKHLTW